MKKTIIIILIATFWLSACSQTNSDEKVQTKKIAQTETAIKAKKETNTETKIEHLTSKTFKEKVFDYEKNEEWIYKGEVPAIIDFYADWCKPCKMVAN